MKASEVHNLKDDELLERIRQTQDEQFSLRFQHATGELENTARLTAVRRDVARLLTVAKERGIDLEQELNV
ncbi:MAG TPA: 50S ribosomal protein L29 [Solirubrobacterales bacterium]|jgi:large subunit ribosomal protein L29|nr:50S ribosomal protein L29 [Solirubrobacterales bacterium]